MRHPYPDPLCDPSAYELAGHGEGKKVGVLLMHGFTASATETRPFADFLAEKTGWTSRGALLAGHGRTIEDLQKTDRFDWLKSAQSELDKLQERGCEHLFLAGVSMGSSICCLLADQNRRLPIRGLLLMAPAFALPPGFATLLRIGSWLRPVQHKGDSSVEYYSKHRLFSYTERPLKLVPEVVRLGAEAMACLPRLGCPALILTGAKDRLISQRAIQKACQRSPGCQIAVLENSRHILTVEPDAQQAFAISLQFMQQCLKGEARERARKLSRKPHQNKSRGIS